MKFNKQLQLTFVDSTLSTEAEPYTGIFTFEYIKRKYDFDISLYSDDENNFYEIKDEVIKYNGMDVTINSVYMNQGNTFSITLDVNSISVFTSLKIAELCVGGTIKIDSNIGFHYALIDFT